jgi:sulfur-carrier protein
MVEVRFTRHLRRFFPDLRPVKVASGTVSEIVVAVDAAFPGLAAYVVTEAGSLRKHVNIFVDGEMIADRKSLGDSVPDGSEVFIMQALSGG